MSVNSSSYNKDYYKQHKKAIAARRKKKYHSDPALRTLMKKRAKAHYQMKAIAKRARIKTGAVEGKQEKLFYLNEIDTVVNRDRTILYAWRRAGESILPTPLFHDLRKRGLYSDSQVQYIAEILARIDSGKLAITYRRMGLILRDVWAKKFNRKTLETAIKEVLHGKYHSEEVQPARDGRARRSSNPVQRASA